MDDPASDPEHLRKTVRQFRLINRLLSRTRSLLRRWIVKDAAGGLGAGGLRAGGLGADSGDLVTGAGDVSAGRRPVTLLELGGGDAEIARWLYEALFRRGVPAKVTSIDSDTRVHGLAQEAENGVPVSLVLGRVPDELPPGRIDYAYGNHFLHHLDDAEAVRLLRELRLRGAKRCLFNDLYRGYLPYFAYSLFAGLFLRGSFAYYDGRASIRRGFRPRELESVARDAGWDGVTVFRRAPGHIVLLLEEDGRGAP